MFQSITNDGPRGAKMRKDILFKKIDHNLVVIGFTSNGFYPFGNIIYNHKDIEVVKRIRKLSHKVNVSYIKSSTTRIGFKDIIFFLEILLNF